MRNAIYTASGDIDCEIQHPQFGWIPFTASPNDPHQHGRDVFAALVSSGSVAPYVAPPVDPNALADAARSKRDSLLKSSDWTQTPDAPVDQSAWSAYRQALRDITLQAGFPESIDWPVAPE